MVTQGARGAYDTVHACNNLFAAAAACIWHELPMVSVKFGLLAADTPSAKLPLACHSRMPVYLPVQHLCPAAWMAEFCSSQSLRESASATALMVRHSLPVLEGTCSDCNHCKAILHVPAALLYLGCLRQHCTQLGGIGCDYCNSRIPS